MYLKSKQLTVGSLNLGFITPVRIFMVSTMIVNGGNYLYNLYLGRFLMPSQFAEAGFIVTLLLIFSFLGMTFQIVSTKYSIDFEGVDLVYFKQWIAKIGLVTGVVLAIVMLWFSGSITTFFNLSDGLVVPIFILVLPLYFMMSVYRGFRQGREEFVGLSMSYQIETWGRFIATFLLLYLLDRQVGVSVASAIVASVLLGTIIVFKKDEHQSMTGIGEPRSDIHKVIVRFFIITAGYEIAQVLINYGDLLLVKHYFDSYQAGLYTSLSLIGKMIYFVTWMVVMILIPRILKLKKQKQPYKQVMLRYIFTVAAITMLLTCSLFFFSEFIVVNFFGAAYVEIAAYLWQYALATSLFALSNMFVYYFLSLDQYGPVYLAIAMGILQVTAFVFFHDTIAQIILVQMVMMAVLLMLQVGYFLIRKDYV